MKLIQALRLGSSAKVALVGGGGKTAALFRMARELLEGGKENTSSIFVTTTTHLAVDQLSQADHHIVIDNYQDLDKYVDEVPNGVILFTGSQCEDQRVSGLSGRVLDQLFTLADVHQKSLLIEADGARKKPLKAPGEHEPVIPDKVDLVIVVSGMTGLGNKLSGEWVHRPERFSELSELELENPITTIGITNVLLHSKGGLKNIPSNARKVVMLNQADTQEMQAIAANMAHRLLTAYDAVIVSSFDSERVNVGNDPGIGVTPFAGPVIAIFERVAAIVLAAGKAERFGEPKQLLMWKGEPLIRKIVKVAINSNLGVTIVITGAYHQEVSQALIDLPVVIIHNSDWRNGQSTSIKAGISNLGDRYGAALFMLADQPYVSSLLTRGLVDLHARTLSPIIAPLVDGQRGNPVLFDRQTFPDLMSLEGDLGGRAIFSYYPITWLPWHDRALLIDIDSPEDYSRLVNNQL